MDVLWAPRDHPKIIQDLSTWAATGFEEGADSKQRLKAWAPAISPFVGLPETEVEEQEDHGALSRWGWDNQCPNSTGE